MFLRSLTLKGFKSFADTTTLTDPRGDASVRFDLTRATISNGQDRIVVTQRVRDLRGRGTQVFGLNVVAGSRRTVIHTVRGDNGEITTRVVGQTVCRGARARWRLAEDTIRISMPRQCIAPHGALRFSAMIGAGDRNAGDPADWTRMVRVEQS